MPSPQQSPAPSQNPRVRRHHQKVFSGCWTCRSKHIKCDEAKPVCFRCKRSGIECQGYGVRLSWTSARHSTASQTPRRPTPKPPSGQIINQEPSAFSSRVAGGRSGLSWTLAPDGDPLGSGMASQPASPSGLSSAVRSPQSDPSQVASSQPDNQHELFLPAWRTSSRPEPSQVAGAPDPVVNTPADDSVSHAANPIDQGSLTEVAEAYRDISWLPNCQQLPPRLPMPLQSGTAIASQKSRHLDSLSEHASRCKILENWTLRVCDALNPLPGILNPIRTIFTPLALEGAREDLSMSTGAVALFHMICSASAFHLSKTAEAVDTRPKFERLALEHHQLGICHLSQNIQSDDQTQYAPILASLIMCLLNEDITVHDPFWRLHIRGAVEWVNHVGLEYWCQTESASIIYQMFLCMGTLIQSQILPGDRSGYGWDLRFNIESHPGPYMIESIFGLPKPILEAIHKMNHIQKRTQEQQNPENVSMDGEFTAEASKEIDALEFELFLMMPSLQDSPMSIPQGRQLIYHYGYTYYYAALLYLKRTLKEVHIHEVQGLVESALQHIEALKAIEAGHSTPCLWPIANIAFETHSPELRLRMLACIDAFSKQSTLLMWEKFGASVRGLWRRRQNPGEENLSWHAYSPIFYHNYVFI